MAGAAPELHQAGHCIRAIEGALRAARELKAIDLLQRQYAEVKCASRFVHGHAVNQHFVVTRVAAADKEGGETTTRAILRHYSSGNEAQSLTGCDRLKCFDLVVVQRFNDGAAFVGGSG